jgi:hypothetical protein
MLLLRCMSPLLAHRVVSCARNNQSLLGPRGHRPKAYGDLARSQLASGNLSAEPSSKGFVVVADEKSTSPSWKAVKAALQSFDRAGLLGLVQDLYGVDKVNKAFLHARLGLGSGQLAPYKAIISRWICPDLVKSQSVSISKAKKAIADYQKAIGEPAGLAELSIFYCEEAFSLLESCAFEDERYFAALIRMYDQAVKRVLELPVAERHAYVQRLGNLRSRARPIGWAIEDELNGVWYEAGLDEY